MWTSCACGTDGTHVNIRLEGTKSVPDQDRAARPAVALAVLWPEVGRLIGEVVLERQSERNRPGEIGYAFNPEFQGKGFPR